MMYEREFILKNQTTPYVESKTEIKIKSANEVLKVWSRSDDVNIYEFSFKNIYVAIMRHRYTKSRLVPAFEFSSSSDPKNNNIEIDDRLL